MISRRLIENADRLLRDEKGTVYKDPGGRVNVCLIYPNSYNVGMSSLGFQGIYGILNQRDDTVCERAFLPDNEDLQEFLRTGSILFSLESKRPVSSFDIVAFSVSFENDYPSIPELLRLSHITPSSSDRDSRDPLLLLGGVCATFNPEPVADLFDLIFVGEAEAAVHEMIEIFKTSENRTDFLNKISGVEGFYIPGLYRLHYLNDGRIKRREAIGNAPPIIRKRTEKRLWDTLRPLIITPHTEFSDMYLLEAMRGCVWNCRFCLAGHIYNPPRHKDISVLDDEIKTAMERAGRVGLIGPSLTDYRHIRDALSIKGVDFSITSLRATPKSHELLRLMREKRSISIAPEAGTDRLRNIMDKRITEEDILDTAESILSEDIKTLRLYFMVGLPFEEESDIEGIVSLVKKIRSVSSRGMVVLSISTFVPKPFTPFQWHPMAPEMSVRERLKRIKAGLNIKGVRVFHDVIKYAFMQGVFSRGCRRLSAALLNMEAPRTWREALKGEGLNPDFYLFRERPYEEMLPWDFIDTGIPKGHLWTEYMKAKDGG